MNNRIYNICHYAVTIITLLIVISIALATLFSSRMQRFYIIAGVGTSEKDVLDDLGTPFMTCYSRTELQRCLPNWRIPSRPVESRVHLYQVIGTMGLVYIGKTGQVCHVCLLPT